MRSRVFLVQWDAPSAEARAAALRADGWEVEVESQDGARAYRLIRATPPDVVVIDLARKPSHGRETAHALRTLKATRHLPIVFVDGTEEAVEKTQAKVAEAVFTTSAELRSVLVLLSGPGKGA